MISPDLITHALTGWLELKFPYKPRYSLSPSALKRLEPRFRLWHIITVVLLFVLIPAIALAFALLVFVPYYPLGKLVVTHGDIFVPLEWLYFVIPGLFLSLIMIPYLVEYVQKLGLGGNYKYFEDYYSTERKYDNIKATKWITKACWYPFIITMLALGTSGLIVRSNGFSIRHFYNYKWSNYKYGDVKRIVCYKHSVENGHVLEDRHVALKTASGRIKSLDEFTNVGLLVEILNRKGVTTDTLDIDN
jgi:hypothetical protein